MGLLMAFISFLFAAHSLQVRLRFSPRFLKSKSPGASHRLWHVLPCILPSHWCRRVQAPSLHFGTVQRSVVEMTGGGLGTLATATARRSGPQSFLLGGGCGSLALGGGSLAVGRAQAGTAAATAWPSGPRRFLLGGRHSSHVLFRAPLEEKKENVVCDGLRLHLRHGSSSPTGARRAAAGGAVVGKDGIGGGGGGALALGGGALARGGGGGTLARAQAGTAGGGLGPSSSELSPTTIASARDDIVMACVRRLAGDGVYWVRLRVSGRVRGATCAAPRKNRPTSLRGAFPSSRAANLTTTRDAPPSAGPPPQPLDGRAAAPRRAPPGTGTGSPMALFLRCWTATRPRGRRPRGLSRAGTL